MTGYVKLLQKKELELLYLWYPRYTAQRRTSTTRAVNPIPYRADYFRHKLHIDHNERLVIYGVTHVVAIDGHSRFVVAGTTMPVKNNLTIYREISKYEFHLLSFVKSTNRYFWIFFPLFDALLSCFSGQFFKIFLMSFSSLSQPFIIRNRSSYTISDLIMGGAFLRDSETSENS